MIHGRRARKAAQFESQSPAPVWDYSFWNWTSQWS